MKFKNITCSTGEIAPDYKSYLSTNHWKTLRIKVAERHQYTCLRCSGVFKVGFHIHHNTYKRLGREKLEDLGFYCNRCHSVIHNDRKNKKNFNRQYINLFSIKMKDFSEEQIQEVLEFIDRVAKKDKKIRKRQAEKTKG